MTESGGVSRHMFRPGEPGLAPSMPQWGDTDFTPGALLSSSSEIDKAAAVLAGRVNVIQKYLIDPEALAEAAEHLFWPQLPVAAGQVAGVRIDGLLVLYIKDIVQSMVKSAKEEGEAAWQAKLLAATGRLQGMAGELRQVAEMEDIPSKARHLSRVSEEALSFLMGGLSSEGMEEAAARLAEAGAQSHANIAAAMAADGVDLNAPSTSLPALTSDSLDAFSTRELRKVLELYKVPTTGLLEKSEFVAAAKQHLGLQ